MIMLYRTLLKLKERNGLTDDLKNKIDYYLTHEDERKEIVGKGKKIVLRNHTFDARAKEISYDLENKKE